jgi:hypothetical protein
MKFSDYVSRIVEAVEEPTQTQVSTDANTKGEIAVGIAESKNRWISKVMSDNSVYLFYNEHCLNMTQLKAEMDMLYSSKGFAGSGYDKLVVEELTNYRTVKDIFVKLIAQSLNHELSAKETAESLFDREIFYA